ncbi:chaperone modulator CbpM [Acidisoma sp. C75]
MITIERMTAAVIGLDPEDLRRWIANAWVRPDGGPGAYRFREIDVARVRLIVQLREDMGLDEGAVPVVLSLLDQLYESRRNLRRLHAAMEATLPPELRSRLIDHLREG